MSLEDQKAGEAIRREVMGTAHVDASLGNATELDMPLQEAAMEHVWGGVWTRDGLDRRTRSIVTVSMLIALQAHGELKGHVRGALNNGVTPEEVREIAALDPELGIAIMQGVWPHLSVPVKEQVMKRAAAMVRLNILSSLVRGCVVRPSLKQAACQNAKISNYSRLCVFGVDGRGPATYARRSAA